MKKWIGFITMITCAFSSLRADDGDFLADTETPSEDVVVKDSSEDDEMEETEAPVKHVGKAPEDTSRSSLAAKYVLAAGAVALGVTALLLVSRDHGNHSHHHHHHRGTR